MKSQIDRASFDDTRRRVAVRRENRRDGPRRLVFLKQCFIARNEQIERRLGRKLRPRRRFNAVGGEPAILAAVGSRLALAPYVGVKHPCRSVGGAGTLDEQADGDALLDVEHVVVLAAVGCAFLLLGVAVQVKHVNLVKRLHQAVAHTAKGRVVQPAVVGDEAEHALPGALDPPLGKADEFDVVVAQPFSLRRFLQLWEAAFVVVDQFGNPGALVGGMPGIRRVAEHHHHRLRALHVIGAGRFAHDLVGEQRAGPFVAAPPACW